MKTLVLKILSELSAEHSKESTMDHLEIKEMTKRQLIAEAVRGPTN